MGHGIPDHILHMPQAVIDSPLGAMLMPSLNQAVNSNRQNGGILGLQATAQNGARQPASTPATAQGRVHIASSLVELDKLLAAAKASCAVVFFTSATCGPCKMLYPLYDELAAETGSKGCLIMVDISRAYDVATRYGIRATPTFITFLKGEQENEWQGADGTALRGNVNLLVQMAWPSHPHERLRVPTFARTEVSPILYAKVPPLQKLLAKMGDAAQESAVKGVATFVKARTKEGPAEAPLPDMAAFTTYMQNSFRALPQDVMFTVVDLLRCGLVDPRFSGYLAEEPGHQTIVSLLEHVNGLQQCPYPLRLVTLQAACNLFSSPLYPDQILEDARLRSPITQLLSTSFLDDSHNNVRVAAASLLFNVSVANSAKRRAGATSGALSGDDEVELAASTLEAITQEETSKEALEGMLLALGFLVYMLPLDGELADLLRAMEAKDLVLGKRTNFKDLKLIEEVGAELLGKGLAKP